MLTHEPAPSAQWQERAGVNEKVEPRARTGNERREEVEEFKGFNEFELLGNRRVRFLYARDDHEATAFLV
jgi:hypothetical protein